MIAVDAVSAAVAQVHILRQNGHASVFLRRKAVLCKEGGRVIGRGQSNLARLMRQRLEQPQPHQQIAVAAPALFGKHAYITQPERAVLPPQPRRAHGLAAFIHDHLLGQCVQIIRIPAKNLPAQGKRLGKIPAHGEPTPLYHLRFTLPKGMIGMEHEKIERINELTRISRERALTPEEQRERAALRNEYLEGFRENMRQVLDSVRLKRPDGTIEPLHQKKQDKQ